MTEERLRERAPSRRDTWRARWEFSVVGRVVRGCSELELMRRAMAFATMGLVTLIPLLIVVATVDPLPQHGFGQWVADGMGLPAKTTEPLLRVFVTPHRVPGQTGALGLALLSVFGLSFVAEVQLSYERIWGLPALPLLHFWRRAWRLVVWLAALTGYVAFEVASGVLLRHGVVESSVRIALGATAGLFFFWWGQHFLLAGRVGWRPLLPGAIATVVGLSGLRAFSALVFNPMIVSSAEADGAVGVVLVVVSWLIGVGFVIYAGSLTGRCLHEHREAVRAAREVRAGPLGRAPSGAVYPETNRADRTES